MRLAKAPAGWDQFSEEIIEVAKERGYFPVEGVYGVVVYDHNSEEKFYFTPSGHFIRFLANGETEHGHASRAYLRHVFNEWMDAHDHVHGGPTAGHSAD